MAAAVSKLGDDGFLARVDGTIHRGHPIGPVKDAAQIPRLGVYALLHLDGINMDKVSELFVDHLMLLPDQPHQCRIKSVSSSITCRLATSVV
ncbi:hypothetical protein GT039_17570 [Streptomyces sp. SID2955]|nr:hypothetical protein [Streptomyces sp. SID2955]